MKIQRVRNGVPSDLEMLNVPEGAEVFVTGETGTLKIMEDPFSGVLSVTPMWGDVTLEPRD